MVDAFEKILNIAFNDVGVDFHKIPSAKNSIFVGFDKENYKCYLKNQEINREQKLLYQKVIDEMNQERIKWKELNKNS